MLLDSLLGWSSQTVQRDSAPISQEFWQSTSGELVSQETALNLSAVFCAVTLLSNALKIAPLQPYRRLPEGGKELATENPLYDLIHRRPNAEWSPGRFKGWLQACKLLWGNGYAEIVRDGGPTGRPLELWPIHPSRVSVARIDYGEGGRPALGWKVREQDSTDRVIDDVDMLHIVGFSADGYTGQSVLGYARQSLGVGIATQNYGANFFRNGAHPSLVIKHPSHFKDEEIAARFLTQWKAAYGSGNSGGTAVLENGLEVQTLGMPNEDAQFLETRAFEVVEIARWFNVPPSKLKDLGRATWANIEHLQIEYVTDGVVPHFLDFEEECDRKLLSASEAQTYFFEFNADGLLRGDIKTRYEAYKTGIQSTFLTPNDVRRRENMNTAPDLDEFLIPVNMTTVTRMNKTPAAPAAPGGFGQAKQPEDGEVDESTNEQPDKEDQFGKMRSVAHQLLEEAWGRVLRKETKAIRAALKKHWERGNGEAFVKWLDEWYPLFQQETAEILANPLSVIGNLDGHGDGWATGRAAELAAEHIRESRGQVLDLLKNGGAVKVSMRLDQWLDRRAADEAQEACE